MFILVFYISGIVREYSIELYKLNQCLQNNSLRIVNPWAIKWIVHDSGIFWLITISGLYSIIIVIHSSQLFEDWNSIVVIIILCPYWWNVTCLVGTSSWVDKWLLST